MDLESKHASILGEKMSSFGLVVKKILQFFSSGCVIYGPPCINWITFFRRFPSFQFFFDVLSFAILTFYVFLHFFSTFWQFDFFRQSHLICSFYIKSYHHEKGKIGSWILIDAEWIYRSVPKPIKTSCNLLEFRRVLRTLQ